MADDLAGTAPAPSPAPTGSAPASPAPVSAARAAAAAGDFGAFDRAEVAKQQGKSLPDVRPASPASAQPAPEGDSEPGEAEPGARTISRRQQAINDYERRIAAQEQRIRALETRPAPTHDQPPDPSPTGQPNGQAPPTETAKQRAARYLALPDAPKVDDFDSYPEYTAAQTLFLQDRLQAEQAAVEGQRAQQQQQHARLIARDQTFRERLTAAKAADPAFVPGLSEEAKNLGGLEHARRSGVTPGPAHIIGELLYDSPHAVAFLKHISADPQAFAQLLALPEAIAQLPPQWRAKAHVDHLVTEFRRLEGRLAYETTLAAGDPARGDDAPPSPFSSSVSSAPPPPPTLTKAGRSADPVRSALERGDFAAYDRAEMARKIRARTAGHGGR
jgi:hypothetical protein